MVIALNVAVFVYFERSTFAKTLFDMVVLYPGNLLQGKFWCLLTSGFLHSSKTHLALNMLGVFVFGGIVERHLGFLKTMFIYVGALFISMLFATGVYAFVLQQNIGIIGASGAVMGLMGAAMLLDPFCITYEMILPLPVMVKGWMFIYADLKGFLSAEQDGVSHISHLFGFLSVALLVYFLSKKDKCMMRAGLVINIFSFGVFLLARHWILTGRVSF